MAKRDTWPGNSLLNLNNRLGKKSHVCRACNTNQYPEIKRKFTDDGFIDSFKCIVCGNENEWRVSNAQNNAINFPNWWYIVTLLGVIGLVIVAISGWSKIGIRI